MSLFRWSLCLIQVVLLSLLPCYSQAETNQTYLFFEISGLSEPTKCEILWWNDDYSNAFSTPVELTQGAHVWYGVALRPDQLKADILSYGLACDGSTGRQPVAIVNGKTVSSHEIGRLSDQRKQLVADIQLIRKDKEKLQEQTGTERAQLLTLIPTDEIITLRQEISTVDTEVQMLTSEKKVLDGALENLDFKKQQSDVFFASEKLLQQYLEEQHNKPGKSVTKAK